MKNQNDESNYIQQKDEGYMDFAIRLHDWWIKEKETTKENSYFRSRQCFFQIFINGIQDEDVKRRTNKWFKKENYHFTTLVIEKAEDFHKQKDEDEQIILPDFKTEDISRYFETEKRI